MGVHIEAKDIDYDSLQGLETDEVPFPVYRIIKEADRIVPINRGKDNKVVPGAEKIGEVLPHA